MAFRWGVRGDFFFQSAEKKREPNKSVDLINTQSMMGRAHPRPAAPTCRVPLELKYKCQENARALRARDKLRAARLCSTYLQES